MEREWQRPCRVGVAYCALSTTAMQEHLFAFTQFLSETDLNHAIDATTSTFSRVYAGVTGQATSADPSSISKLAGRVFHTAQTSASAAPPATLRDPLPPRHDVRLDATNTHYVGQGTNLR